MSKQHRRSRLSFGKSRKSRKSWRSAASTHIGRGFESLEARLTLSANPALTVVPDQIVNEGSLLSLTDLGAFTDIVEGGAGGDAAGLDPLDYTSLANSTGAFDPLTNVVFNTDTLTISGGFTGVGTPVAAIAGAGAYQIAVFAFTDFELDAGITITATGSRPFALLSLSDLTVAGTINVSATSDPTIGNFNNRIAGPGGGNGGMGGFSNVPFTSPPFLPGDPAAGAPANSVGNPFPDSFAGFSGGGGTGAGHGGNGGRAEGQQASLGGVIGNAYGNLALGIQGGSGGGTSGGGEIATNSHYVAGGGGGGGGIELGAVGTIEVSAGGQILANGGEGAQGANFVGVGSGGGGAGGGILLHAESVNQFGLLSATGGNGGTDGEKSGGGGGGGSIMIVYSDDGTFNNTGGTQTAAAGVPWFNGSLGGEAGQAGLVNIVEETLAAPIIESFNFVINWGDSPSNDIGSATIDTPGVNIGDIVEGSFNGSHTYVDNGVFEVTVTINDNNGGSSTETFFVTVNNVAPTATFANGGAVDEGSSGSVAFSGQFDPSSADTTTGFRYSYDFDNDGVWEIGDGGYAGSSTMSSAAVPATFLADGPAARVVKGRIIDDNGGFTDYTTTITVNNVDPTADAGGPYLTFDDTSITLTGSGTDVAGALDPLSFSWDLDNDGDFDDAVGASATFDPVALGLTGTQTRTVRLKVTDGDGGETIDETTVQLLGEGTLLIDGVLHVVGSNTDSDLVLITQCGSDIYVFATFNDDNPAIFAAADVDEIQVRTRGGHDVVVTTSNVVETMTIDGGSGNDLLTGGGGDNLIIGGSGHDTLYGSSGDDVLLGGTGNDDLFGGAGSDVLVGGAGCDVMYGGSGRDLLIGGQDGDRIDGGSDDDILIGGYTVHDNDLVALDAIMAIWGSSASFSARVNTLTGSGGLLQAGVTVFDDDDSDNIIGGSGRDLAFGDTSKNFDGVKDSLSLSSSQDTLIALN